MKVHPTGDQYLGNSSASLKQRCQKASSDDPHTGSMPRAAGMPLARVGPRCTPPFPVTLQQSQALGAGYTSTEKAALPLVTAVCCGDSSHTTALRDFLLKPLCVLPPSHPDACTAGTWPPASAHQGHPAGTAGPCARPPRCVLAEETSRCCGGKFNSLISLQSQKLNLTDQAEF